MSNPAPPTPTTPRRAPDALAAAQRATALVGAAATAGALGVESAAAPALAAGVLVASANLAALRFLGGRALAHAHARDYGAAAAILGAGMTVKMAALLLVAYLMVRVAGLSALPFALGCLSLVPALLFAGWRAARADAVEGALT